MPYWLQKQCFHATKPARIYKYFYPVIYYTYRNKKLVLMFYLYVLMQVWFSVLHSLLFSNQKVYWSKLLT